MNRIRGLIKHRKVLQARKHQAEQESKAEIWPIDTAIASNEKEIRRERRKKK